MFHAEYVDILADEFPQAKFICTIRDCSSWLASVLDWYRYRRKRVPVFETAHVGKFLGVDFSVLDEHPRPPQHQLEQVIDGLLRYWSAANTRILSQLPSGRSLVVRTHELSSQLDTIAQFIGVPRGTLDDTKAHANQRKHAYRMLDMVNAEFIDRCIQRHCATIMREYFPEFSLTHKWGHLG